jgi:hypothetical protein
VILQRRVFKTKGKKKNYKEKKKSLKSLRIDNNKPKFKKTNKKIIAISSSMEVGPQWYLLYLEPKRYLFRCE